MKKFLSACMICLLIAALLTPCAGASLDFNTSASRDEMEGLILVADYPADEYFSSFTGDTNGSYAEIYSYEDVGVMVHNLRHSVFGGQFDEVLFLTNNYGTIKGAEWVDIEPIGDAYLTARMRFEINSTEESGPKKWIADVVKVYYDSYYYMFVVARDADGKDYAKKVDTLIDSLQLTNAKSVPSAENSNVENFFAPRDAD